MAAFHVRQAQEVTYIPGHGFPRVSTFQTNTPHCHIYELIGIFRLLPNRSLKRYSLLSFTFNLSITSSSSHMPSTRTHTNGQTHYRDRWFRQSRPICDRISPEPRPPCPQPRLDPSPSTDLRSRAHHTSRPRRQRPSVQCIHITLQID
jgi:hypothetical protein